MERSLLNITDVTEGPFLSQSGTWNTYFSTYIPPTRDWVLVGCTLGEDPRQQGEPLPFGNETLATINFTVLDLGNCILALSETKLLDDEINPYSHKTKDGQFEVLVGDINRDGKIDESDIAIIDNAYGSLPGYLHWNEEADIWGPDDMPDGIVNIYDLAMCSKKYGESP